MQPVAHLQRVAGQVRKAQLVLNYAAAAGGGALLVLRHAVPLSRTVRSIEYRALERAGARAGGMCALMEAQCKCRRSDRSATIVRRV